MRKERTVKQHESEYIHIPKLLAEYLFLRIPLLIVFAAAFIGMLMDASRHISLDANSWFIKMSLALGCLLTLSAFVVVLFWCFGALDDEE